MKAIKIIILVLVFAVVAYFGYKWYMGRKAKQSAPAAAAPGTSPVVDRSTGLAIVRDLHNGLKGDVV